ncbi:HAD family hydrolase [uncultured Bifidobacterium sp.]|uniref:HAD family hydrolase n=1 Tax=uncultured Bifidobacterium sp. TaxID=165187 RepID=UPI00262D3F28|nr:HAD family hydrolase [uncultured Bifidobacterium sp.]
MRASCLDGRYDAVFFDLYGTLVDIRTDEEGDRPWNDLRSAIEAAGGSSPLVPVLRGMFGDLLDDRIRDLGGDDAQSGRFVEPDVLPVYEKILSSCGISGDVGSLATEVAWRFRRASTSLLRLYPGALDMLREIRRAGRRTVLVSNAQSCYTRPEIHALGLEGALDRILISSEEGVRKPDARFFERALCDEGIDSGRVVMVGNDQRSDIAGARAAGIAGVYMRTAISPSSDGDECPLAMLSVKGADYSRILEFVLE